MAQIQLRDPNGGTPPRLTIAICEGKDQPFEKFLDPFLTTDFAGNQGWPFHRWPADIWYTFHVNVIDKDVRYESFSYNVPPAPNGAVDVEITVPFVEAPPAPVVNLSALHVDGDGPLFRDATNAIARIKYATGFDAPRLVHVKDWARLRTYAAWVRSVNGNGLRMFGNWIRTGFDYRNISDYFTRVIPDLNSFMRDEGLGGEFVCICDNIPSDPQKQTDFINRCRDTLADFLLVAEANEPWKNGYDPQAHSYPAGRLMTKGAPEAGTWPWPYVPTRGFTVHHSPRSDDWARKCGKDSYEIRGTTRDAVFDEEPPGFAEYLKPWSRVNNPDEAFIAGVGAGMFSPGMVAHGDGDTMQLCNVPGPIESECVRRCFEGVDFSAPEAPTWLYGRYGPDAPGIPMPVAEDLGPGKLTDHQHAMIGPGRAVFCNYYPSAGWRAVGVNGWRVVKQDYGAVLCER